MRNIILSFVFAINPIFGASISLADGSGSEKSVSVEDVDTTIDDTSENRSSIRKRRHKKKNSEDKGKTEEESEKAKENSDEI